MSIKHYEQLIQFMAKNYCTERSKKLVGRLKNSKRTDRMVDVQGVTQGKEMSQLIQMRRRIKAIETIKKITSAMRLISRSFHTRLHKQQVILKEYHNITCTIFSELHQAAPTWKSNLFAPDLSQPKHELVIIIGGQKGLCGNFNSNIFYWIDSHQENLISSNKKIIVIGRRVEEHLDKRKISFTASYEELKAQNLDTMTDRIVNHILNEGFNYTSVQIISNHSKTFFIHEQKTTQLIPFTWCAIDQGKASLSSNYVWEHDKEELLLVLATTYLKTTVKMTLFESLLGEQSARFISMDNATRNAKNFLESMRLSYNKARQAKITKELAELSGAFESDSLI